MGRQTDLSAERLGYADVPREMFRLPLNMTTGKGSRFLPSAGTTGQGAGNDGALFSQERRGRLSSDYRLTARDGFRRAGRRDAWRTQVAWSDGRCAAGLTRRQHRRADLRHTGQARQRRQLRDGPCVSAHALAERVRYVRR